MSDAVTANSSPRLPWNNLIFPGNYVTRLERLPSTRRAGTARCFFLPTRSEHTLFDDSELPTVANFLQVTTTSRSCLLTSVKMTSLVWIVRSFIVPGADVGGSGATVYRIAINTVNLKGAPVASTITTNPTDLGTGITLSVL